MKTKLAVYSLFLFFLFSTFPFVYRSVMRDIGRNEFAYRLGSFDSFTIRYLKKRNVEPSKIISVIIGRASIPDALR